MDPCPKCHEKFVDYDRCVNLIEELHSSLDLIGQDDNKTQSEIEKLVEDFKKLTDPYLEQPELLEGYIEKLILKLTSGLDDCNISSNRYHTIFKFLYQLIKITGFKKGGKKFPHETDKLPLLVELLSKEDTNDKINWQTRYVLTIWLSVVILTPFDLVKFDYNENEPGISEKIYSILMRSLKLYDSCQPVTAYCLAEFLSRHDIINSGKFLDGFMDTSLSEIASVKLGCTGSMDDVQLIGYLKTLCYMFKSVPRSEMKLRCERILNVASNLDIEKINRELVVHLLIKLVQRAGLALLPKRVATWRYKRGARILGHSSNWINDGILLNKTSNSKDTEQRHESVENEEEVHAADHLESILNILFIAAQNSQTKIRWSAAKGIARLGSRLSKERASAVVDMVLENFFESTSSEYAWHGGCLALAEMSRNGLILVEKLPKVIHVVSNAVIYDKIKGSFPVGAHVREAACYVCWAMARTYEDSLLEPYIPAISINLLCTMLFDRDLQCRRAASATFQELVGRQGTFNEEGINILTNVDYQNVGQRPFTYVHLALQVASYGEKYSKPFVEHLLQKKIGHWDVQVRRLAGDSLSALMLHCNHDYINSNVIPHLKTMIDQDSDNNSKHGAILAMAKVMKGLKPLGYNFDSELVDFVGGLVEKCKKQLKSKQQEANFMEAIGLIISSAEIASFSYCEDSKTLKDWEEEISLRGLDSDSALLRDICSDAIVALYRTYYKGNKMAQDRVLTKLNRSLASKNESSRCGALKALSKLCIKLPNMQVEEEKQGGSTIRTDADTPDIILMSLTSYISKETREKDGDGFIVFAQAKAEACEAFVNFVSSLDAARLVVSSQFLQVGYEALLVNTEDYTFDKRGDIGVLVRNAAVKALQGLTLYLLGIGLSSIFSNNQAFEATSSSSPLVGRMMARIIQQAVSYNNSARALAGSAFHCLVGSKLPEDSIPHKSDILKLFDKYGVDDVFNWRDDSTPIFVNLLEKPEYSLDLWTGLLPSVGQVSDVCAQQFRVALSDYISSLEDNERFEERQYVFESFLRTLEREDMADRLLTSGLIVADYLLTAGLLSETSEEFQERLLRICWESRSTKSSPLLAGVGATNSLAAGQKPAATGKLSFDPKRLISVGRVMSSMLQFGGKVQREALKCCLVLLANGFANVRASMGEQLYQAIMTYQEDLEDNLASGCEEEKAAHEQQQQQQDDEKHQKDDLRSVSDCASGESGPAESPKEEATTNQTKVSLATCEASSKIATELDFSQAMELLSQTNWTDSLQKVKPVRDKICYCLMVVPTS